MAVAVRGGTGVANALLIPCVVENCHGKHDERNFQQRGPENPRSALS